MTHDLDATNRYPSEPKGATSEPVLVLTESAAFQLFEQWMDDELARLVQQWKHTAAPNADRPQVDRARFGH